MPFHPDATTFAHARATQAAADALVADLEAIRDTTQPGTDRRSERLYHVFRVHGTSAAVQAAARLILEGDAQ